MVAWHDHMDALTEYCTISVSNMYLPKVIKFKLFHTLEVWKLVHIPPLVMPFFSSVPLFKDVPISLSFFTSPSLSPHNHLFPVTKIEQLFLLASSPDWIAYFYCIHYLTREVPSPNVWFLQVQFVSSPRTNIAFGFQPSFAQTPGKFRRYCLSFFIFTLQNEIPWNVQADIFSYHMYLWV